MIFLDSSFLVSVEVENDQNHERAIEIMDEIIKGKFGNTIISDYIFDETLTVTFGRTKDLSKAVLVGEKLKDSAEIIYVGQKIFEEAFNIFKFQKNTRFSFTDCTILALMRWHGIKNIATFDEDFEEIDDINVVC